MDYRIPSHPGQVLEQEFLKPRIISQSELARHINCTHAKINEIINTKRSVSPEMALAFSDVFGTSSEFWMNLQRNYDLYFARLKHKTIDKISKHAHFTIY